MASTTARSPAALLAWGALAVVIALFCANGSEAGTTIVESSTTFCDFVFTGELGGIQNFKGVPNFVLKAKGDNKYGTPIIHKSGIKVMALNTKGRCVFPPYSMPRAGLSCHDNFYFISDHLATRTFQKQEPVEWFENLGIRLYFDEAQLVMPNGTTLNLWPRDQNQGEFPEMRRCILFTTNTDIVQPMF